MSFVPAYSVVKGASATGEHVAFVLHGILGSGRNWRTFARRLAARAPAWTFVLFDLRHHGDSGAPPPPHTLDAVADDLAALAAEVGRPQVVIGHSFGGKVAACYAGRHPDGLARVTGVTGVRIGGFELPPQDILYVGAAPCCAGLYQIVVRTPADLPTGDHPVIIGVDGASSPMGPTLRMVKP